MADPICRWRNATPKTICELISELPKNEMPEENFKKIMNKSKWGEEFLIAPYQLACQTGLYYIDENRIYHPRFRKNIDEVAAEKYLKFWFRKYYVPNPYTKKGFTELTTPIYFEQTLYELLKKNNNSSNFQSACNEIFKDNIGELDILKNLINRYSNLLEVEKEIVKLKEQGVHYMEVNCNRNDKKAFFDMFSDFTPSQTIYYGVPGSGKSHKIDELTKNLSEEQVFRIVFHPEYTNADFVGQILPSLNDGGVDYRFKAGPFSRILKKAIQNPNNPYYLIIEEINRGNAAAIFGELFQLLDRDEEGYSCYEIENLDINAFIRSKSLTHTDSIVESSVKIGENIWTEITGIRLPPNLSILATMNTSDQNVFTLDNAFQRRWDMELVPNTCDDEKQMNAKISACNKTITWGNFQSEINKIIAEKGNESGFSSMEDKRLGCWFIKNEDSVIKTDKFANKVLKYLWDDAFKFNRNEIFTDEIKNFEELKKSFLEEKGFGIFKDVNFTFEPEQKAENQPESTEQADQIEESQEL